MDEEDERILAMTEKELRNEFLAEGLDWDTEVARVKSIFECAVADVEFYKHFPTHQPDNRKPTK